METTFAFRELIRSAVRANLTDLRRDAGKLAQKHGADYVRARINQLERQLAFVQEAFVTTVVICPACDVHNRVVGQQAHTCGKCRATLTPPESVPVPRRDTQAMTRETKMRLRGDRS